MNLTWTLLIWLTQAVFDLCVWVLLVWLFVAARYQPRHDHPPAEPPPRRIRRSGG